MKTWKKAMAVTMVVYTLALPGLANAEEMMMPKFNYSGIETITKDEMELVPLRQVAESLGFKVTWNDEKRSIMLTKKMMDNGDKTGDKQMEDKKMEDKMDNKMEDKMMKDGSMDMMDAITIQIENRTIMVGTMEAMLMYAPTIINDKTYVSKELVDQYLVKNMK